MQSVFVVFQTLIFNLFVKFFSITKIIIFLFFLFFTKEIYATVYLTKVSDLLSTSAPGAYSNQTIRFVLNQEIPANGAIEIYFDEGGFTIPSGLNYTDIDIAFSSTYGGPYTDRPISSVQSAGTDGVTVTTGASGMIRIDLNTSVGISAGDEVMVEIGTNATYGGTGDVQMQLSNATSSYPVTIYTYDDSDNELDYGRTMIAVVDQVTIGPVDTTDTTPPVILSAEPSGILQVGTRAVEMSVQTDEISECKYATSSMAYSLMPYSLSGTTSGLTIWHFAQITGLEDDTDYTYYIRCIDYRLNEIDPDYVLTFTVGITPGSSSSTATTTGSTGSGTGSSTASSTCTGPDCNGTGTGSGSGGSGSGSGSSPNGGDGSGGGNGGSSGGDKLQQADVKIEGWAYPGATVSFFRDGVSVSTKTAGSDASFSNLTEDLDRGSYSFGIYAVDSKGVRSATFSTTLWLQPDTLNVLSNIMLPPTVSVKENSVQAGTLLEVSGYTAPNAVITTWLRPKLAEVSNSDIVSTTTASAAGHWSLTLPTSGLSDGTYELVAQAKMQDGMVESDKSARKTIGIGVEVADGDCKQIGDLNCDGFVNLVDFSILLFNWNTSNEVADINEDGFVSLPDFSVMLYNWTG